MTRFGEEKYLELREREVKALEKQAEAMSVIAGQLTPLDLILLPFLEKMGNSGTGDAIRGLAEEVGKLAMEIEFKK